MLNYHAASVSLTVLFFAGLSSTAQETQNSVPPESPKAAATFAASTSSNAKETTSVSSSVDVLSLPKYRYVIKVNVSENTHWSFKPRRKGKIRGDTIKYTFEDSGLGDSSSFTYDESTGVVSIKTPLDFEQPADDNQDNKYVFGLRGVGQTEIHLYNVQVRIVDQKEVFGNGPSLIEISGETEDGHLGQTVSALGDVDQDGMPDIAVSAPGDLGQVYFISGFALGQMPANVRLIDGLPNGVWQLDGGPGDLSMGSSMAVIGDLDNDGINDLALNRNETEIMIVSGATIAQGFSQGGRQTVSELDKGIITVPEGAVLDPDGLAGLGDLTQDGVSDLGLCLRFDGTTSGFSLLSVGAVSGLALGNVMTQSLSVSFPTLAEQDEAGSYGRESTRPECGPLAVLGDMSADGRTEMAIPFSTGFGNEAGFFTGTNLSDLITYGLDFKEPSNPTYEYFWRFYDENDPHIGSYEYDKDFQIAPLGDVTGDDLPDFGITWNKEHPMDDLAVIVKGGSNFFDFDQRLWQNAETAVQSLVESGQAIRLTGPFGDAINFKRLYSVQPPVDGLHEPLIFAQIGDSHLYSFYASDLPDDGSTTFAMSEARRLHLPTVGLDDAVITGAVNIGDINHDGYGDLAITYSTAASSIDPGDLNSYYVAGAGRVYIASGAEWKNVIDDHADTSE